MWIGIGVVFSLALILLILARFISKGNIGLIHSYHTGNIREKDVKAYTKLISSGLCVIAFGLIISGIFMYFGSTFGVLASIFSSLALGLAIFNKAQKKYNSGWFS